MAHGTAHGTNTHKLKASLAAAGLAFTLLTGCTAAESAPQPESTSVPLSEPATATRAHEYPPFEPDPSWQPNENARFLIEGAHTSTVVDRDGNVILRAPGLQSLPNYNSGWWPIAFAQVIFPEGYSSDSWPDPSLVKSALYDLGGALLAPMAPGRYLSVGGSVISLTGPDDTMALLNANTGETLLTGLIHAYSVSSAEPAITAVVSNSAAYPSGFLLLDMDGTAFYNEENMTGYAPSFWNGYILSNQQGPAANKVAVLAKDGTPLLTGYDEVSRRDELLILSSGDRLDAYDSALSLLWSMEIDSNNLSYATADHIVFGYNNGNGWESVLRDLEGNTLSAPYYTIAPGGPSDEYPWLATKEEGGIYYLATDGSVAYSTDALPTKTSLSIITKGRCLYYTHGEPALLLDETLTPIATLPGVPTRQFAPAPIPLLCMAEEVQRSDNSTENTDFTALYTLYTANGAPLIENLLTCEVWGDRVVAEQGLYRGLMDLEGNWLYKESRFDALYD